MSRPSRTETRAQARERLLDAAERAFAGEGFEGREPSIASPRRPGSRAGRCIPTSPTRRTCSSPSSTAALDRRYTAVADEMLAARRPRRVRRRAAATHAGGLTVKRTPCGSG